MIFSRLIMKRFSDDRDRDRYDMLDVFVEGELEVSREGTILGRMGPGRVFGELAILYNCTRTASVKASTDVKVWVLDRPVFQMITMRMGMERHQTLMDFLRNVELLKNLPADRLSKLADVSDQVTTLFDLHSVSLSFVLSFILQSFFHHSVIIQSFGISIMRFGMDFLKFS